MGRNTSNTSYLYLYFLGGSIYLIPNHCDFVYWGLCSGDTISAVPENAYIFVCIKLDRAKSFFHPARQGGSTASPVLLQHRVAI
jgi:hypothetical protein